MEWHLFSRHYYITVAFFFKSKGNFLAPGIEQNISNKTKLLAETNYDIDDKQLRISGAVLFGWKKFRLALGLSYYHPQVGDLFETNFWPVINLWWRF